MNDDIGPDDHRPPDPGGVPSEWSPPPPPPAPSSLPSSSLPPPPATASSPTAPPSVSPFDDTAVVSTGPIMAEPAPRAGWFGRGVALVAAVVLVGGGGYLAINAGSDDGGADSPDGALDGALEALSAEDLIGAAEFVEPTERATMIDAGVAVVEELIRLDVFADTLDLEAVDGIDLQFDDVVVRVDEVRPGLAHLFIESGTATTSLDGAAVPFGPLITDRVDGDDLAVEEGTSTELEATTTPIVAVERDGRWYLSLWYTAAENARIESGLPLPDAADRLAEIGADTPERAVEDFVAALEELDLATMIGMLDPLEAAALYDYGSLFVADGQRAADEFLAEVRGEGWSWDVTELDLRAETDGNQATVFVQRLAMAAEGDDAAFDATFTPDRAEVGIESPEVQMEMLVEGDCITMTFDEGDGPETERTCTDDLLDDAGLGSLGTGAFGGITTIDDLGIVTREVGGRWYISPIRTGSEMVLASLRALDADLVAATVDGIADLFRDPFAFESSFESSFGGGDDFGFDDGGDFGFDDAPDVPTTTFGETGEYPPFTEANAGLLAEGPDYVFVYDLVDAYRDDVWWQWLTDVERREFETGVIGQAYLPGDRYVDIIVLTGVGITTDQELIEWLGGELVTDDGFTYVSTSNSWGESLLVARSADGVAVVSSYDGIDDAGIAALRNQIGG